MRDEELLGLLNDAVAAVGHAIDGHRGRGLSGVRPTQYHVDIVADDAAVEVLTRGGLRVLSEESGSTGSGDLVCVLDPIDGSTNADRGIPFYSTSACVLDVEGMRCAIVHNHVTGTTYEAVRGAGARRDGAAISTSRATELSESIVGFSGLPSRHLGWAQFRALGSASLELCAVADGSLDAYAVTGRSSLSPWDYLGGMLVVLEAGGACLDMQGQELVVATSALRQPLAASTRELADSLHEMLLADPR